jgi:hypothetical protein
VVDWHYGETHEDGYLVAVDGPLRQPFADYVQGTEDNARFDVQKLPTSSLQQIPKERQLSFGDMHQVVSRLEAMKIAKEQALVREMAAEYTKDGQAVPQSALIERYKKTIDLKLGNQSRRQTKPEPVAPKAAPIAPAGPRISEPPAHGQQNSNLTPIFCSNHNSTEKRNKTASRKVECPTCKEAIQTNYAEFSMCHACSRRENRCLCCGSGGGVGQQNRLAQENPIFCSNHNQSEKRKKTQPRDVQCASCKVTIQTNYVDFTVCAPCSQSQQRCVCCGAGATMQSASLPSTASAMCNQGAGMGFPQLQGLQMMNRLPSQCALQPTPLVAHNLLAPHNVLASFNQMASPNHMMSQKVF